MEIETEMVTGGKKMMMSEGEEDWDRPKKSQFGGLEMDRKAV
jgi:hypothetical protein